MASVVGTTPANETGPMRTENDMLGLEQRARELAYETGGGSLPIREPVKFVKGSTESQDQPKITYQFSLGTGVYLFHSLPLAFPAVLLHVYIAHGSSQLTADSVLIAVVETQ
ncbi:hypothetical protein LOD99_13147 [Oopsacas minuta]|uniref:Uncharacterized protein n=1 Tax=Oopsacas minuta TaxID=111878 RepID=A0AAV7JB06_9METZ|nr:hypothetical protein LOD99_13147 [Oopsacas minuta]